MKRDYLALLLHSTMCGTYRAGGTLKIMFNLKIRILYKKKVSIHVIICRHECTFINHLDAF